MLSASELQVSKTLNENTTLIKLAAKNSHFSCGLTVSL